MGSPSPSQPRFPSAGCVRSCGPGGGRDRGIATGALEGLLVLDLSENVAGPFCTKLLAGFGALVVKVERPGLGDRTRRVGPFPDDDPHPEKSPLFLHLNTGKKSISLDLECAAGRHLLQQMIQRSDVLVESSPPGTLARLGLDDEMLQQIRPGLVVTSITPFGQDGPYAAFAGGELVTQALGGYLFLMGEPEREPLRLAGYQAEYQAGLNAAVATMAALYERDETGEGAHLDVSIMECVATLLQAAPQAYLESEEMTGRAGPRLLLRNPTAQYPSTTLACRDGYVHVHGNRYHWEALALFAEEPRLLDERLKSAQREYADEIDALMRPWIEAHTRDEAVRRAQELRLPFASVLSIDEVMADPQHAARAFFVEVEHPVAGQVTHPGAPCEMPETPWQSLPAPLLGEHNEEIYCGWLDLPKEELVTLRQGGVI